MKFHEEFSTILDVRQNENDLTLRLDTSDWLKLETYKDVVLELKLAECQNARKSFEEIKQNTGELIWTFEFLEKEKVFNILLDNGDIIEIRCGEISEKSSDLTIDELLTKFQWLTENYQRESESGAEGWEKYQRLNDLLKTEVEIEIKNWEKKKTFFEQNKLVNAGRAETVIKLCKRVLNYIHQVERDSNA